jgi:hypothetical protein
MRYFFFGSIFYLSFITQIYAFECRQDTLTENSDGQMLQTLSGDIFESLAGDNITAYLWLPMSDLLICGPNLFDYKGKVYEIFDITNIDDDEKISALSIISSSTSSQTSGGCYNSSITKPTPFMGNNDEVFVLSDGSVWQIKYEYEYMYEYYPSVVACPNDGYVVVGGTKLNAVVLK